LQRETNISPQFLTLLDQRIHFRTAVLQLMYYAKYVAMGCEAKPKNQNITTAS
jgi:hypothetical protein